MMHHLPDIYVVDTDKLNRYTIKYTDLVVSGSPLRLSDGSFTAFRTTATSSSVDGGLWGSSKMNN